jgi:hypothetical protein
VVIDNLDIKCMTAFKAEAQPPLAIDANAVSADPVAFERFEPVVGRNPQIVQLCRAVQHLQFALGDSPDVGEPGNALAGKQRFRIGAFERLDDRKSV